MIRLLTPVLLFTSFHAVAQTQVPNVFEDGTPASAAEVNANFDAIEAALPPANCTTDQVIAWNESATPPAWECRHPDTLPIRGWYETNNWNADPGNVEVSLVSVFPFAGGAASYIDKRGDELTCVVFTPERRECKFNFAGVAMHPGRNCFASITAEQPGLNGSEVGINYFQTQFHYIKFDIFYPSSGRVRVDFTCPRD